MKKQEPVPVQKKLTEKEQLFCIKYCANTGNATQAAISAGYSEKTAGVIGSENLKKPYIAAEINRLRGDWCELAEKMGISKAMIAAEHLKIVKSSIAHLHNTWIERKDFDKLTEDQKACIQEISTKTTTQRMNDVLYDVEYVKIKLYDKQKALDAITKLMGYDAPTKLDLRGSLTTQSKYDLSKLSVSELKALKDAEIKE